AFDFGAFTIVGAPGTSEAPVAYCPRRTILDKLLVDAAARSGAEVREGFTVEEVLTEDGRAVGIKGRSKHGGSITERAEVVGGARRRQSGPTAMTRNPSCLPGTTRTGADYRCPAGSKLISATDVDLPPLQPTRV